MAKIYTKTGDKGETGLFGGARVPKHHPRVEAYGDVDELNSALGLAAVHLGPGPLAALREELLRIQHELFEAGAVLADPKIPSDSRAKGFSEAASRLERGIDKMSSELPELRRFILPGGSPAAALLHLARSVCRRAERRTTLLSETRNSVPAELLVYLNRLSDYLFTAARFVNAKLGAAESEWEGGRAEAEK